MGNIILLSENQAEGIVANKVNINAESTIQKGKVFVMGDIHGAYKALLQCFERSGFDYENDTLIQVGDVADGWSEVYECVEELLKVKNLIALKGNHDDWFNDFIVHGIHPVSWSQGGFGTAISYLRQIDKEDLIQPKMTGFVTALNPDDIPPTHQRFFRNQHLYYIDDKNRCFVHGGFNRHMKFRGQLAYTYYWDRDLWFSALSFNATEKSLVMKDDEFGGKFKMKDKFLEVFIGHTDTNNWKTDSYMKAANIYNLDCGAGWSGRLCMMNVDTKEAFYSDNVQKLYPNEKGRH